jgi:hypothetical protein
VIGEAREGHHAAYADRVAVPMSRWRRAIGIRPGESRTMLLIAGLFACLEAGRGFG